MKPFLHLSLLVGLLLISIFCISCHKESNLSPAPEPITKCDITTGPYVLRVNVSQDKLQLSDILHLTIEAEAPESLPVEINDLTPNAEQFTVSGYNNAAPVLTTSGRMTYSRTYDLELLIADKHEIPSITCRYGSEKKDGSFTEITTDPFTLDVAIPDEQFWASLDIDDQTAMTPYSSANPRRRTWILASICISIICIIILFLFWMFRRRKIAETVLPPPPPAHVTALRKLDELLSANLPLQGKFKEFYQGISDITRTYIEARFDVHAPEQTTEEFLHNLTRASSPLSSHHDKLKRFLAFCDLVKFAEHEPTSEDVEHTIDACRIFIDDTKQEERQA